MTKSTIGRVARVLGIRVDAIRFYERQGLIEPPPRTSGGYRIYGSEAVRRLEFIRQAKELGFTLVEIKELISLESSSGSSCADVRARALQKLATIDAKINELHKIRRALSVLAEACPGAGSVTRCTILDALRKNGSH